MRYEKSAKEKSYYGKKERMPARINPKDMFDPKTMYKGIYIACTPESSIEKSILSEVENLEFQYGHLKGFKIIRTEYLEPLNVCHNCFIERALIVYDLPPLF